MLTMDATKFLLVFLSLGSSTAFELVSPTKTLQNLTVGQELRLSCQADGYYEYCWWRHREETGERRECSLEWKYKQDKVIKTECHEKITGRTRVSGDYSKHECAITISAVRLEDAGLWQCELESYVLGGTRGYRKTQNIMVAVAAPTTSTTSPSSTSSTTSTTTETTETSQTELETTTYIEEISIKYDPVETETESQPPSTSEENFKIVKALPVTETEEAEEGSSVGLIAGVIVSLLTVILVLAAIGVTWQRRRKSQQAIISYLQTERDDQMAASSFLEEAEYHINIIRDPQNLPLQQQKTIDSVTETDKL